MLASVYSAGLAGIDGYIVTVESDAKERIHLFELVGLPDAAVKEAKERVRAACENSGFIFLHSPRCRGRRTGDRSGRRTSGGEKTPGYRIFSSQRADPGRFLHSGYTGDGEPQRGGGL